MKANYRGFEIEATRERALGGWSSIYYTVIRTSDGWFLSDGFTEAEDKIRDFIGYLKEDIDHYYENPSDYED